VVMRNDPRTGNQDIWVIDLATGNGTAITNDVYPENGPIWSPDGKQVAFLRSANGTITLWVAHASGGDAKQVSQSGAVFGGFVQLPSPAVGQLGSVARR